MRLLQTIQNLRTSIRCRPCQMCKQRAAEALAILQAERTAHAILADVERAKNRLAGFTRDGLQSRS